MNRFIILGILLTGCTYSLNQVSTKGTASDIVDEVQTPSTTVSPQVSTK